MLTDTGDIFSGGDHADEKLGFHEFQAFSGFKQMTNLNSKATAIACINDATFIATMNGEVLACGRHSMFSVDYLPLKCIMNVGAPVQQIAVSASDFIYVTTVDGRVFKYEEEQTMAVPEIKSLLGTKYTLLTSVENGRVFMCLKQKNNLIRHHFFRMPKALGRCSFSDIKLNFC
jgi:hypothetical protein